MDASSSDEISAALDCISKCLILLTELVAFVLYIDARSKYDEVLCLRSLAAALAKRLCGKTPMVDAGCCLASFTHFLMYDPMARLPLDFISARTRRASWSRKGTSGVVTV